MNLREECEMLCLKYNIEIDRSLNDEEYLKAFENETINKINCIVVAEWFNISEEFVKHFANSVDWIYLWCHKQFSESFIRDMIQHVSWYHVCQYQALSESFIRDYCDKVDWHYIIAYQNVSEEFLQEFKDKWSDAI